MKFLIFLSLLCSYSAFSNVDIDAEIKINEKSMVIQNKNIKFEKTKIVKQGDFKITYRVSKKIPKNIPVDYNNQKSVLFNVSIVKDSKIISNGEIVTLYGKEALLETSNEYGLFKVKLTANETLEEKSKRIASIERLPVYTESVFPVSYRPLENVKRKLEKLLSKKGKIDIDLQTNSLKVKDTLKNIILINNKFNSIDI